MNRKKSTMSNNIEAQNRLTGGILGMIPATLVGGPIGAIASFFAGILGANQSINKANKNYNPYKRTAYEIANDEFEAYKERKRNGDKFANMERHECDRYFANFRKDHSVIDEIYGFNLITGSAPTTLGCYEILGQMEKDSHRDICTKVLIENDIIRMLEEAIEKGEKVGWYKYEHRKYFDAFTHKGGYYVTGYSYAYSIGIRSYFPISQDKANLEVKRLFASRPSIVW